MADVTFTAAEIAPLREHGAVVLDGRAGGAITVGHLVYMASDGDWERADANVSAAVARAQGIAVASYDGETTIASGDPVSVCVFGPVAGFSSLTPGANLYISDTVGRIADAAATYDRIIGWALTAGVIFVSIQQNDPSSA